MKIMVLTKKRILIASIIVLLGLIGILQVFFKTKKDVDTLQTNSNSITTNEIQNIMKSEEKVAYLTFDDGPNPLVTPKVLDILKENDIKATFFVIGKHVDTYPEIVKRAYEEGHYIANHSYEHNNNTLYKSEENFIKEIQKTDDAIARAIGKQEYHSFLFRFPNGYMAPLNKREKEKAAELLSKMNYTYIDWNCLNHDSMKKYTKAELVENLKKTAKNKKTLVILMHDTQDVSDSSLALQENIDYLKKEEYVFKTFYENIETNIVE